MATSSLSPSNPPTLFSTSERLAAEFQGKLVLLSKRLGETALCADIALLSIGGSKASLFNAASRHSLPMLQALIAAHGPPPITPGEQLVAEFQGKLALLSTRIAEPVLRANTALLSLRGSKADHFMAAAMYSLPMLRALVALHGHAKELELTSAAASTGNLACLEYMHVQDYDWDRRTLCEAALGGHLECLQYAVSYRCDWGDMRRREQIRDAPGYLNPMYWAARGGDLPCMQFLHENGCEWEEFTTHAAATRGHLACLQYAVKNGCKMDDYIMNSAAEGGNVECLQYLVECGCYADQFTMAVAAQKGHLKCLQYLHENGHRYIFTSSTSTPINGAAEGGHLECMQYLHNVGYDWGVWTTHRAATTGQLACLQYAVEHGCPWHPQTTMTAVQHGQLACLQYAVEHGCPWYSDTTDGAAGNGNLDCLKYAVEHKCPWHKDTTATAARNGHLACLQYAVEHGCPWHPQTTQYATGACIEYCQQRVAAPQP
jgi:hypothetical protein